MRPGLIGSDILQVIVQRSFELTLSLYDPVVVDIMTLRPRSQTPSSRFHYITLMIYIPLDIFTTRDNV